jgi:signal peptidase II
MLKCIRHKEPDMNRKKELALALSTAAINILLDRVTKAAAEAFLKGQDALRYLSDTIVLKYTENTGAFLSLGAGWPSTIKEIVLLYLPLLVCALAFLYCCAIEKDRARIALLVTIVAGGAGNLLDRIARDFSVVDFMNFGIGPLRTGVLNVADLSITFGAIGLVIHELRSGKR